MILDTVPVDALLREVLGELPRPAGEVVTRAFELARRYHTRARPAPERRDEGVPPLDHPARVMYSLFKEVGVREADILAAALLHDVLEIAPDPRLAREEIERACGPAVAGWVDVLTRRPGVSREAYAQLIKDAPYPAFLVEMAARLDNLRNAHRRRKNLQPYFNETRRYYLTFAERRAARHPELAVYVQAMRMAMEGE